MSSSAKNKGREGQKEVAKILLQAAPSLEPGDIVSRPMNSPGEDLIMSPAAKRVFRISPEVKRRKRGFTFLYDAIKQTSREGSQEAPTVFVRQDREGWLVVQRLEDWLKGYLK